MTKLNPWTMPPSSVPASETNVRTPRTSPRELTAGPPLLPHAAGASVWMTGWFVTSCLKPEIAPFVTDASTLADALSSSWLSTTPGKPRMWSLSPICAFDESPSASDGMSAASSFTSARSRPDMPCPATGGLYLTTVAGKRMPFERITEIDGASLIFAPRIAAAVAASSTSPHAWRTPCSICCSAIPLCGRWAGETTWPFVTTQPLGLMNHPVPVSRNGTGVTRRGPPVGHVTVTSDVTSARTSRTAGLARSTVSWTEGSAPPAIPGTARKSALAIHLRIDPDSIPWEKQRGKNKKKAPGASPWSLGASYFKNCFSELLHEGHRLDRLRLGGVHVAGLASCFGFADQLGRVATSGLGASKGTRRLHVLTTPRGLHVLPAPWSLLRVLRGLAPRRRLNILATARRLHILATARGLHVLPATRRLNILTTARGLHILPATRRLNVLAAARGLHILTSAR